MHACFAAFVGGRGGDVLTRRGALRQWCLGHLTDGACGRERRRARAACGATPPTAGCVNLTPRLLRALADDFVRFFTRCTAGLKPDGIIVVRG